MTDAKLVEEMTRVAAHGFDLPINQDLFQDVAAHVSGHIVVELSFQGICQGFVSVELYPISSMNVLYIAGMVMEPALQGKGIGQIFAKEATQVFQKRGILVDIVAGRTQNPRVAASRRHYVADKVIYPIDSEPDIVMQEAASCIQQTLEQDSQLERGTLIVRNAYRVPRFKIRPLSGDEQIDAFFQKNIGPLDAVYVMGKSSPSFR